MFSSKSKFLLDENVRAELHDFLVKQKIDALSAPKGAANGKLASLCLTEKRILVTNDSDFAELTKPQIFGVVWLRIPQNDVQSLITNFAKLLNNPTIRFEGKLIVLGTNRFDIIPLVEEVTAN